MNVRCYKSQFTVGLCTRLYIEIIVRIEYDNDSSQIPIVKRLFYCKTKRIFMNILFTLYVQGVANVLTIICLSFYSWLDEFTNYLKRLLLTIQYCEFSLVKTFTGYSQIH